MFEKSSLRLTVASVQFAALLICARSFTQLTSQEKLFNLSHCPWHSMKACMLLFYQVGFIKG